jgi:hypothetical protein
MTITRRQALGYAAAVAAAAALPAVKAVAMPNPEIEIVVFDAAGAVVACATRLTHEILWQVEKAMILDGFVNVKVGDETKRFSWTPRPMSKINKAALNTLMAVTKGV